MKLAPILETNATNAMKTIHERRRIRLISKKLSKFFIHSSGGRKPRKKEWGHSKSWPNSFFRCQKTIKRVLYHKSPRLIGFRANNEKNLIHQGRRIRSIGKKLVKFFLLSVGDIKPLTKGFVIKRILLTESSATNEKKPIHKRRRMRSIAKKLVKFFCRW